MATSDTPGTRRLPTAVESVKIEHPAEVLLEVEAEIIERVDVLIRKARRGCAGMRMAGMVFELRRTMIESYTGEANAFLDDPELMSQAVSYDEFNSGNGERMPLRELVVSRLMLMARVDIEKVVRTFRQAADVPPDGQ